MKLKTKPQTSTKWKQAKEFLKKKKKKILDDSFKQLNGEANKPQITKQDSKKKKFM